MQKSPSYNQQYQQLQVLQSNLPDSFKLHLVKQRDTGQYRTAKKTSIYTTSQLSQDQLLNQIKILKQLSNPHIIKYYDVFLEGDQFIVILEFCEEGDLGSYAQRKKEKKQSFSEKLILSWVLQILMALEYIHTKNIIHRMVCSQNIYMNHQGDLKLGSFGGAKMLQNTMQKAMTVVGSACNLSPEIVQGKSYDNKIDIWGLGCLIYELANHQHPFKISSLPELYQMIVKSPPQDLPIRYSKYLNPIYKKMMKKNPNYRPSAAQLLQQQVFIKLMKQYTKKKKIDSLDLRQVIPKQLLSHKNKNTARLLPPIAISKSPSLSSQSSTIKIKDKTPQTIRKSSQKMNETQGNTRYKQSSASISNNSKLPLLSNSKNNQTQEQVPQVSPNIINKQKQKSKQKQQTLPSINKNDKKASPKSSPKTSKSIKTSSKTQTSEATLNLDKRPSNPTQQKQKQKQKQKTKQKQPTVTPKKQAINAPESKTPTTNTLPQNENRLTLPDLMQGQYISLLCQIKLQLLEKKYSPNMSQIFEQTIEFDQ